MYYREIGDSCKKSVKFDGKKFMAPGGAWNDREYFVTLSKIYHKDIPQTTLFRSKMSCSCWKFGTYCFLQRRHKTI